MTESTKTRRTAAEKAQETLTRAEQTLDQKENVVMRLREELKAAEKRLIEAQQARDYAFAHPALKNVPVDETADGGGDPEPVKDTDDLTFAGE